MRMDVMDLRRGLMAQMGTRPQIKEGSFLGNANAQAEINIGFEPDIVVITRDSRASRSVGMQQIAIIKGIGIYNSLYYTSSGNIVTSSYGNYIEQNDDPWGAKDSLGNYVSFAVFENGILTVKNATGGGRCFFINGDQYSWVAIKK